MCRLRRLFAILLRHRWLAYLISLAILAMLYRLKLFLLYSGDEKLYIEAGRRYVSGTPPVAFNFEHPPLAKYIIGLCLPVGRLCPILFGWTALVALGEAGWLLGLRGLAWLGLVAASTLDPILYSISGLWMLDVFMLSFFGLGFYAALGLIQGGSWPLAAAAGALLGAAFASKMMCLAPCLAVLALVWRKRGARHAFLAAASGALVYLASYVGDIAAGGLRLVFDHHVRMLSYMHMRHGFEPYLAAAGILFYFARCEVWGDIGTVNITFVNGTLKDVAYMLHRPHPVVRFEPYMGSLLLPLSPIAAVAIGGVAGFVHLASLWSLLYGPLWWYLVLPAYTGHLILALWLASTMPRRGWIVHTASSLVAMTTALFCLLQ